MSALREKLLFSQIHSSECSHILIAICILSHLQFLNVEKSVFNLKNIQDIYICFTCETKLRLLNQFLLLSGYYMQVLLILAFVDIKCTKLHGEDFEIQDFLAVLGCGSEL